MANRTKGNFYHSITKHNKVVRDHKPSQEEKDAFSSSMNSYLGIMKHYRTFRHRKKMMLENISGWWWNYFCIAGYKKLILRTRKVKTPNLKQIKGKAEDAPRREDKRVAQTANSARNAMSGLMPPSVSTRKTSGTVMSPIGKYTLFAILPRGIRIGSANAIRRSS